MVYDIFYPGRACDLDMPYEYLLGIARPSPVDCSGAIAIRKDGPPEYLQLRGGRWHPITEREAKALTAKQRKGLR